MLNSETAEPQSRPRLHGLWTGGRFQLWGESVAAHYSADKPDPIPPSIGKPRHPFACSTSQLHALLGELCTDSLLADCAEQAPLLLKLPTRNDRPLHSAEQHDSPDTDIRLVETHVPALSFPPAETVDLLTSLPVTMHPACSDSLRYWSLLARFMMDCLSRQQFVPDILTNGHGPPEGRWRLALFDAAELAWLERFASAMPKVCRSAIGHDASTADPIRLIDTFLAETVDAVIRRILTTDEFFDDVGRRANAEKRWELSWLASLVGKDRHLRGDVEELSTIAAQIQAWSSQTGEEDDATPQISFRMEAPEGEDDDTAPTTWRLQLEAKVSDDETPLDLASIWNERPTAAAILGRRWGSRRANLMSELGRAAAVYPRLRSMIHHASPRPLELSTDEAYSFMREIAPLLVAEGFDVELPEWARQSDRRLGLELSLRPMDESESEVNIGRLGLGAMLEFNWRVAVGDDHLTLEDFEKLTRRKAPLVRLRGRWVSFDRQAAEAALAYLKKQSTGKMTLMSALRLVGGVEDMPAGLPIVGMSGAAWVEKLLRDSPHAELEAVPQPSNFRGELRPYQVRGVSWLAFLQRLGIGACLADDMGLGKTIQLIALLLHERQRELSATVGASVSIGPTLLFAPMSVVGNWEREIQRFAPSLRILVHHGPQRLSGDAFVEAAQSHDVVITTYGLASRCLKDFNRVPWRRIALDEAQKIKNPSAAQTVALRSLHAPHRVALTGTPVENHLSELWSIMEVLNPGLLGSAASFRARFAVPIEKLGEQERAVQLRRLIQPFLLRRLKSDPTVACDLPEKMEMRVYCNLTPEQAAFYERTVNEVLNEVDHATGIRRRGLILAALTRLKQICNHPAHFLKTTGPLDGRSGKCERLVEMLEEVLEEGDAALVFTQYREMGELLLPLLKQRLDADLSFLHGGTTAKKRNEMIDRFQDPNGTQRIFLLSLKAGGFGLNLTKANHVFHFDRWWNPAVEDQATDRAHRIGQTRRVQVHKFVCVGTVEERIDKLLTEKSQLAEKIVGSGDEWLTGLSTLELKEYLSLSSDAVSEND